MTNTQSISLVPGDKTGHARGLRQQEWTKSKFSRVAKPKASAMTINEMNLTRRQVNEAKERNLKNEYCTTVYGSNRLSTPQGRKIAPNGRRSQIFYGELVKTKEFIRGKNSRRVRSPARKTFKRNLRENWQEQVEAIKIPIKTIAKESKALYGGTLRMKQIHLGQKRLRWM
ncbi:hypothetical protein B0H19DRAFT_1075541 [Mycena capillaripes]|nr:hypothetical protein B0H19DRAFT_1075541 [Mycena capillaripes]